MGGNPMALRIGMEKALEDAVAALRNMAKEIKSDAEIRQVATISAESAEIGTIIGDTIKKVGKDGVVTVEESQSFGVESEVVEGLQFDKGYVSPYMITNAERMEAEYRDVPVLITDKKISSVKEILPLLEKLAQSGKKELVIIADDVDGEALTTFVLNKIRGGFSVLAVKAPGYGDRKREILEDIALVVGADVISDTLGAKLDTAELSVLGKAAKVIATKDSTVVVGGKGKKAQIDTRIAQIKKQREASDSKFDIEKLDERIAKLSGGVAVIRVGAATETEMKYLKLKIEDAVNATKAAIEEGIVAGGGTALVKVAKALSAKQAKSKEIHEGFEEEFFAGYSAVVDSLRQPLRQIAINAGRDDGSMIVEMVGKGGASSGYDAFTNVFVDDMFKAGIIDPVKVTRSALQNAVSAASILLTTEVAVAEEPKEEKPTPDMGGGMGMGY
jgi:chaperonin GroEL